MNKLAVFSLLIAQVALAINWYAISAVYSAISVDLKLDVSGLGLITSAFIASIGLFQVPAGILAAKVGPRKVAIWGTIVASLASALTGFAPNLFVIAALRFVSGIGMAAIPACVMMLAARLFRKGSEGLSIGLADGAYAVGGIIALSSWTVLSGFVGWRASLLIGGVLELAIVPMLFWALPVDQIQNDFNVRIPDIRRILFDKRLLIVGIALLALEIGWTTNGYFMVFYLEDHLNISPLIAGLIGSLTLLTGVIFSPLVGRINDRISKPQRLMFVTGIICAVGLVATSFNSVNGAIVSTILVGSSNAGGFAVGFIVARETAKHQREYEALGMSWVSTVSFIGSFWIPGLFSSIALQFGYSAAWVVVALLTVVLTFPVISFWPKPQDTSVRI